MSDILVVNASPLIALAEIGYEHLLSALAKSVLVPTAVEAEILAGPQGDPARRLLEHGWAQTVELDDKLVRVVLQQIGETWPPPAVPHLPPTSQGTP